MPAVARTGEPPARGYVFAGPEVRRMTAEQFADAIGSITGEWNVDPTRGSRGGPPRERARRQPDAAAVACRRPRAIYARDWRVASNDLTRALGRPIRDQVTSIRAVARRRRCRRWSW